MSKLSQALKSHDTGIVFPARSPVRFDLATKYLPERPDDTIVQRQLKATFAVLYAVDRQCTSDIEAMERNARALVIEGIFGEFRVPLMEVMRALSEHDVRGARERVAEIMRQMFDE